MEINSVTRLLRTIPLHPAQSPIQRWMLTGVHPIATYETGYYETPSSAPFLQGSIYLKDRKHIKKQNMSNNMLMSV